MRRCSKVLLFALFVGFPGAFVASGADSTDSARQLVAEWVQARKLISEEEARWREEHGHIRQMIYLLEKEKEALRNRLGELDAADDEAVRRRSRLSEKDEALLKASKETADVLSGLEHELIALRAHLPPPLQAETAPLFSRLEEAAQRSVGLSQRLQTVLGLLGEINRFQRTVTLARETRELGDGARREVQTVYLGLAQAYFVDENGRIAGTGRPVGDGWEWSRDDRLAPSVGRVVAILQNQRSAEFVNLPVEVAK